MEIANITIDGKEVQIYYANAATSGYGHKKIEVKLSYEGNYETFYATTTNMPGYDASTELEGEERYIALYELIDYDIEEEVIEWLNSLD